MGTQSLPSFPPPLLVLAAASTQTSSSLAVLSFSPSSLPLSLPSLHPYIDAHSRLCMCSLGKNSFLTQLNLEPRGQLFTHFFLCLIDLFVRDVSTKRRNGKCEFSKKLGAFLQQARTNVSSINPQMLSLPIHRAISDAIAQALSMSLGVLKGIHLYV